MNKPADLKLDTVPAWIGGKPVSSATRYGDVFNPASGQVHSVTLQLLGAAEPVYLSTIDLWARWGFVGLTVALCVWAVAETLQRAPQEKAPRTPRR